MAAKASKQRFLFKMNFPLKEKATAILQFSFAQPSEGGETKKCREGICSCVLPL
jgi:hypothetical protein